MRGTLAAATAIVHAVFLIAIGCCFVWPRPWVVLVNVPLALLALVVQPRDMMCCFCFRQEMIVANPYREAELGLVVLLVIVALHWRRVAPRPRRVLRRAAGYAASLVVVFTLLSCVDANAVGESMRVILAASSTLIACLAIELHLHVPPLPVSRLVSDRRRADA